MASDRMNVRRRLHHVGFVVSSIAQAADSYALSFGASWDGVIIHDPSQQTRVAFFSIDGADPLIELVEPAAEKSPVSQFLSQKGGGLHHLCYEVGDLAEQLRSIRTAGGLVVRKPAPAAAFDGRRIAWVYTRDRVLLEYLEA